MTNGLERLAEQIIGCKCYVLTSSDGANDDLEQYGGHATNGCTSRTYDLTWREWLEARGLWCGRRPAMWVHDTELREQARELAGQTGYPLALLEREAVNAVTIHEAAHVVEQGIDLAAPTPGRERFALAVIAYGVAESRIEAFPSWWGHDWRFIRLCLHLAHRAAELSHPVSWELLYPAGLYQIPRANAFAVHLGDEPQRLARVPAMELANHRPPDSFLAYWRHVVDQWKQTNPPAEQIALADRHIRETAQ